MFAMCKQRQYEEEDLRTKLFFPTNFHNICSIVKTSVSRYSTEGALVHTNCQRADGSLIQHHVNHILSHFTREDNLESQVEDVDIGVPQTREEPTSVALELRRSTQERLPLDCYTPERC